MGLQGVVRGKTVRTTISNAAVPCPLDRVNRQFTAPRPNVLWVSDFTYVATWAGFVYGADEIAAVATALNSRPRKTLDWKTPSEALDRFLLSADKDRVATTA